MYMYSQTFAQYFVEALLAAITASSIFEYDATILAHLFYNYILVI